MAADASAAAVTDTVALAVAVAVADTVAVAVAVAVADTLQSLIRPYWVVLLLLLLLRIPFEWGGSRKL